MQIETLGLVGEVLLSITTTRGRLPLLFGRDEIDPGYVVRVVRNTLDRYAL